MISSPRDTRVELVTRTSDKQQYVSFWVNQQLLGVPVDSVQEVLTAQHIAPVPRTRPEIAGLLNLRGQIVTAVDLRKCLGLPPRDASWPGMNVVLRYRGESFSLLVDDVGDVIEVQRGEILPPPRTLESHWKNITAGIVRLDNRLFILLDCKTILGLS